jgi:hypothetical protein
MDLSKEQILGASLELKKVAVKQWGGNVYLRPLSGEALERYQESVKSKAGISGMALLLTETLCDSTGKLLFTQDDIAALTQKHGGVLVRLSNIALRMNAMTEKDIDELEKNSAAT